MIKFRIFGSLRIESISGPLQPEPIGHLGDLEFRDYKDFVLNSKEIHHANQITLAGIAIESLVDFFGDIEF